MIHVEVRNFQSIAKVALDLDGFTALAGRSNIGKSALVRAIQYALTNESGTSFVRHDKRDCMRAKGKKTCKCFTAVHLKSEGLDLLWEKGDSVSRYIFNGQTYDKPGQGTPDFLLAAGFAPVKIGSEYKTLQVADQFFPIFLLDQSGPAVAEVISDVARLDRINAAMRMVEKDKREIVATRKVREKDIESVTLQIEVYAQIESDSARIAKVEAALAKADELQSKVSQLSGYIDCLRRLMDETRTLQALSEIPVPSITETLSQKTRTLSLHQFEKDHQVKVQAVLSLEGVETLVIPQKPEALTTVVDTVLQLDAWSASAQEVKKAYLALQAAETMVVPEAPALSELLLKEQELARFHAKAVVAKKALADLELANLKSLEDEKRIQEEVDASGVCPTCAQPLKTDHTHA